MKTTDNQFEIFDVVNEADEVIGRATRAQCHGDKTLIHRAIGVIVINDQRELFLQKRSKTKDTYPGYWTLSATGHVDAGDSYERAAIREAWEEIGIQVQETELMVLGKILNRISTETEYNVVFGLKHNGPFKLHPTEIETGEWYSWTIIEQALNDNSILLTPMTIQTLTYPTIRKALKTFL